MDKGGSKESMPAVDNSGTSGPETTSLPSLTEVIEANGLSGRTKIPSLAGVLPQVP